MTYNTVDGMNRTVRQGYDAMREYTDKAADLAASVSKNMHEFTQREPWLALAAAFMIGYTMARLMHRVTGKSG